MNLTETKIPLIQINHLSNPDEYEDTSDIITSILFSNLFLTIHSKTNGDALLIALITANALMGYIHLSFSIFVLCLFLK